MSNSLFSKGCNLLQIIRELGVPATVRYLRCRSALRAERITRPFFLHSKYAAAPLKCRPNTSDFRVFDLIFVQREFRCLDDLGATGLIIDCGANVGYSAAYLLSRFPQTKVIAVEPDPENFVLLQENLLPYGPRARVLRAGLWSHSTGLVMAENSYRDGQEWSRQVRPARPGETPAFPAIDLGTILADSGCDRIAILKIDIERSEIAVFSANYASWLGQVDNLVIELHDTQCREVFFRAIQGQDFQITESGELTVCQRPARKTK